MNALRAVGCLIQGNVTVSKACQDWTVVCMNYKLFIIVIIIIIILYIFNISFYISRCRMDIL